MPGATKGLPRFFHVAAYQEFGQTRTARPFGDINRQSRPAQFRTQRGHKEKWAWPMICNKSKTASDFFHAGDPPWIGKCDSIRSRLDFHEIWMFSALAASTSWCCAFLRNRGTMLRGVGAARREPSSQQPETDRRDTGRGVRTLASRLSSPAEAQQVLGHLPDFLKAGNLRLDGNRLMQHATRQELQIRWGRKNRGRSRWGGSSG